MERVYKGKEEKKADSNLRGSEKKSAKEEKNEQLQVVKQKKTTRSNKFRTKRQNKNGVVPAKNNRIT